MLYLLIFVVAAIITLLYIRKMAKAYQSMSAYNQRDTNEVSQESTQKGTAVLVSNSSEQVQENSTSSVGLNSSQFSDLDSENERLEEEDRVLDEMNEELEREGERSLELLDLLDDDAFDYSRDQTYDY